MPDTASFSPNRMRFNSGVKTAANLMVFFFKDTWKCTHFRRVPLKVILNQNLYRDDNQKCHVLLILHGLWCQS